MRPGVMAGAMMGSGRLVSAAYRIGDVAPQRRPETTAFEGTRIVLTIAAGVLSGLWFKRSKTLEILGAMGLLAIAEWLSRALAGYPQKPESL